MPELTESYVHAVLDGRGWQISDVRGSMGKTRLAERGDEAVAVKLVDTPLEIMTRLAEIDVTPPVLMSGVHEGSRYVVQQAISGPYPDHAWFANNLTRWADLVGRYLNDDPLRRMLAAEQGFWRLAVPDALTMINSQPAPRSPALRDPDLQTYLERWRQQATEMVQLPLHPVHPDPHWHNYVIAKDRPYLLDWEHIDLSDPIRDVGLQIWGFIRRGEWPVFLHRVGIVHDEGVELAIYWWAGFKMIMNAWWNDRNDDEPGAEFHAGAFRTAVDRQPFRGD